VGRHHGGEKYFCHSFGNAHPPADISAFLASNASEFPWHIVSREAKLKPMMLKEWGPVTYWHDVLRNESQRKKINGYDDDYQGNFEFLFD